MEESKIASVFEYQTRTNVNERPQELREAVLRGTSDFVHSRCVKGQKVCAMPFNFEKAGAFY